MPQGIGTSIKLNDQMTPQLKSMCDVLDKVCNRLDKMDSILNQASDWDAKIRITAEETRNLQNQMDAGARSADKLGEAIRGIVTVGAITKIGQTAFDWIKTCTDAFGELSSSTMQLQTTLKNMIGGSGASSAFDQIIQKANEIEQSGMFDAGSMIAGAAELSTYMTDPQAILSMMDTLTDYATGMSGGAPVSTEQMVNYATGIAKVTTGAYDAMTKKGFAFTDAQKAVLKGEATQAQLLEAMADYDGWEKMTDDMRVAAIMSDVIGESWDGLYESMSNTPTGKIAALTNQFNSLQESIGQELSGYVMQLIDALSNGMDTASGAIDGVVYGLEQMLNIGISAVNAIANGAAWIYNNWNMIGPAIEGVITAVLAYKAATMVASLVTSAMANPWLTLIEVLGVVAALAFGYGNSVAQSAEMSNSALGTVVGAVYVVGAAFTNFGLEVANIWIGIMAAADACANNMQVAFHQAINWIKGKFYELLATVWEVIGGMLNAINKLPGVNIGTDGVEARIDKYSTKADNLQNGLAGLKLDIGSAFTAGTHYHDTFAEGWATDAFKQGAALGDGWSQSISDKLGIGNTYEGYNGNSFDWGNSVVADIADNTNQTAKNSKGIKDKLDDTQEDLKYLCDIAEREAINRFTTADINVTMTNNNSISSQMDIEDVIGGFADKLQDAMALAAEGV